MSSAALGVELFREAISRIFNGWTALQLAVEHQFGGKDSREKAQWMEDVLHQYFYDNRDLQVDEVEEFVAEILNNEFNLIVDDNSVNEVSGRVCHMFTMSQRTSQLPHLRQQIEQLPKRASLTNCHRQQQQESQQGNGDDTESESEWSDDDQGTSQDVGTSHDDGASKSVLTSSAADQTQDPAAAAAAAATGSTDSGMEVDGEGGAEDEWTVVKKKGNKKR